MVWIVDDSTNKITKKIYLVQEIHTRISSKQNYDDKISHLTFDRFPSRFVQRTGTTFWTKQIENVTTASTWKHYRSVMLPDKQMKIMKEQLWVYS